MSQTMEMQTMFDPTRPENSKQRMNFIVRVDNIPFSKAVAVADDAALFDADHAITMHVRNELAGQRSITMEGFNRGLAALVRMEELTVKVREYEGWPPRRDILARPVYKRQDGMWTAQYTDFTGKRRYLYGKTQQAVKDKLKKAIQENDDGILSDAGRILFAKWAAEWLEVYAKPVIRQRTYRKYYNEIYLHIIPAFPRVTLKEVREDMLQKFLNEKQERRIDGTVEGYASSTIGELKSRLYAILEKAVDLNLIAKNPAKKLRVPRRSAANKEKTIFTKEQQQQFEEFVTKHIARDMSNRMFLLMLHTGLRIGEACGLRVDDVDFERHELRIERTLGWVPNPVKGTGEIKTTPPKTVSSKRLVPLSADMEKLLQDAIADRQERIELYGEVWKTWIDHDNRWIEEEYLFLNGYGNVYVGSYARELLQELEIAAGVPLVSPHGLRHTFATRWVEAGLDIKSLTAILGHADAKITLNRYTHSLDDQRRESMEKLSEALKATDKQSEETPEGV